MSRTPWFLFGLLAAAVGLAGLSWATRAAPAARVIEVEASEFKYVPQDLQVQAGEEITVTMRHVGAATVPHDIVFELDDNRRVASRRINGGQTDSVSFVAPAIAGDYVFFCSVGQHRARGMVGTLIVSAGPPPPNLIDNLNNPHGITVVGDGTILVGEGGTGDPKPPAFAPGNGDGRVQRISLADPAERTVVLENLTNSIDPGGGIVGANHAIEWAPPGSATGTAKVVLVAQSGGPGHLRPDDAAKILKVEAQGAGTVLADVLAYETAKNPDGGAVDSNPWRLVPGPGGLVYIPDAGGNAVLRLDPRSGELSTYAVFPAIGEGDEKEEAIPTGMVFDPRAPGIAYVALLAMFVPGEGGEIRRLEDQNGDGDALDDGENVPFMTGLRTPTDLAFGPSGHLFVTEIAATTLGRIDTACWKPSAPCAAATDRVVVASELHGVSGLAFDTNGDALAVTTDARPPMGGRPLNTSNRVVRIRAAVVVPRPTATPTTMGVTPTSPTPTRPTPTATPGRPTIFLPLGAKNEQVR